MSKTDKSSLAAIGVGIILGVFVAWAGSVAGARVGGIPVFVVVAVVAYVINWLVFVPSYLARTEHYFDLTGSATYIIVIVLAAALSPDLDARAMIVTVMVIVWALRLGSFLFARVRREGRDGRFDRIKTDALRFAMSWTLQGLWIVLTLASALAIVTAADRKAFGLLGSIGAAVWVLGFAIEVVADRQKGAFRSDPANADRFIDRGLWAWSRHPNYFGEIVLWLGIAIMAVPVLSGWRWLMLISPVFVFLLLTRVSGIPLLEARADKRWGSDADYRAYKTSTPSLVPRPPSRAR